MDESQIPTVYIGKKNKSFYVNVCIKLFERGERVIVVEALGTNICKAVDVANYFVNMFKKGATAIDKVEIDMVEGQTVRGLPKKVSRIRIYIVALES